MSGSEQVPESRLADYQQLLSHHYHDSPYRGLPAGDGPWVFCETPSCGDEVRLSTSGDSLSNQRLEMLAFEAEGCVISQAGVSLMCHFLMEHTDRSFEQALSLSRQFQAWVSGGPWPDRLQGSQLECLRSTRDYPLRHRCLELPWRSLDTLLAQLSGSAKSPIAEV